jgi:hypothetical protein
VGNISTVGLVYLPVLKSQEIVKSVFTTKQAFLRLHILLKYFSKREEVPGGRGTGINMG